MMPTPRLFRSRWAALWWAVGIVWFAIEVAGVKPGGHAAANAATANSMTDATGSTVDEHDLAVLANAMAN
ncbi:MAG: hypothetical protein J0I25_13145 [Sphingomonadales bacterium]|nr:hypothetical protein [Sphingomonadales bacterium]